MINILRHSITRLSVTLSLIVSLISIATPYARAFDGAEGKSKEGASSANTLKTNIPETSAAEANSVKPALEASPVTAEPRLPRISYVLFSEAMKPQPELLADMPKSLSIPGRMAAVKTGAKDHNISNMSLLPRAPAASTAPLSPGEKFHYFAKKSFLSISPYALSVFSGLIGEATDKDHGRHMSVGDFLADAGTHAARGFTFRATSNFFEKFAYATIFRQDPRYHRSDKRSLGGKVIYAVTRVFVTQGDRCGCDQVNISFLAGGLTASGIAQTWRREEDRTIAKVFTSWASHIGVRAFTNILSEFIGGQ
jgi:hypothetical protein